MLHYHRHVSRNPVLPRPSQYSPASLFYRLPLLCLCGGRGQDSVLFLVSELKKKCLFLTLNNFMRKKKEKCIEFFFFGTKKNTHTHIYIKINQRCVGGLPLCQRERAGFFFFFFWPCEFKSAQASVAADQRCALSWHRGILMMDSSFFFFRLVGWCKILVNTKIKVCQMTFLPSLLCSKSTHTHTLQDEFTWTPSGLQPRWGTEGTVCTLPST